MLNIYIARMRSTWLVIRYEFKCYLCIIIGKVKVAIFFNKFSNVNKLEIGAGKSRKSEFITCDLNISSDYPFDLKVGLPFPDNSIDLIYAEHVLEHFNYNELNTLLADCFRVLRRGGEISISVPNVQIYVDAYKSGMELDINKYARYRFGLTFSSKIDYLNHIFYMDGQHRYMFDHNNLLALLSNAGFDNVRLREFDQNIDQESRKHMSLFVKAEKKKF